MSAPQAVPAPTTAKHIAQRIKQLESELCCPMPYGDRKAASQEYIALREMEEACAQ
jgi:hypothetical protein